MPPRSSGYFCFPPVLLSECHLLRAEFDLHPGVRNPSLCLLLFLRAQPDSAFSSSGSSFGMLISFPTHLICNQVPVLSLLHGHRVLDVLSVGIEFLLPGLQPDFLSTEESVPLTDFLLRIQICFAPISAGGRSIAAPEERPLALLQTSLLL
jgi:hypothetical protein